MRVVLISVSVLAAVVAVGLGWMGYRTMTTYDYANRIVGGDAYNYIIMAAKGTGIICAGVIAGLLSCTLAVLATMAPPDAPSRSNE